MVSKSSSMLVFLLVVLLSGCASPYPRLDRVKPLPEKTSCRAALLPFYYEGKFSQGRDILYKAFINELKNTGGFDVAQEGDVRKVYQQLKLYKGSFPNENQIQIIGSRLDAQFVILGEIIRIAEVNSGSYVDTRITAKISIFETLTGNVLWTTYHKRHGEEYRNIMHYGRVNTITGLSRRMANEIVVKWLEEGMNQCIKN